MKKISPNIKLKIIELSNCFWYWNSFYVFYASILGVSVRELEKRYPRDTFNKYKATGFILDDLENDEIKIKNILSAFYKLKTPYEKGDNPKYAEAIISLREFKELVGKDVLEDEIKQRETRKKIEKSRITNKLHLAKEKKIDELKAEFYNKSREVSQSEKQKRGFWLEKIFYELLKLEDLEGSPSYKTKTEQIDGYLKFKSFDYLVEIKWVDEKFKQVDVSIFDGKIKNKAQSNRGLVLSINGFDDSAIQAAEENRNLIFMDAQDLIEILERRIAFFDFLSTKEDQLVRLGLAYKK